MAGWIGVIVLIVLGIAMISKPEVLWKAEHLFSVKNGEPTDFYLACMRLSGVFFLFMGIGMGIYGLVAG